MQQKTPKIGLVSLGCAKNLVDSQRLTSVLVAMGYRIENEYSKCDVVVVNTCGFIGPAKEESIDTIFEMAQYKQTGRCKLLCVTGCLSQRYGENLAEEIPEADIIVGISQYDLLPGLIEEALQGKRVLDTSRRQQNPCGSRVLTTKPYTAYVAPGGRRRPGADTDCPGHHPLRAGSEKHLPAAINPQGRCHPRFGLAAGALSVPRRNQQSRD